MQLRSTVMHIRTATTGLLAIQLLATHALASCPAPQFQAPIPVPVVGFGPSPQTVTSGDFNNDGLSDLLVTDLARVNVFLADGSGHFRNSYSSGNAVGANASAILDVDNDGNLDFATAYGSRSSLQSGTVLFVQFGNGSGHFEAPVELDQDLGTMADLRALVSGDFNGDGKADLVLAARDSNAGNRLTWCLGDGTGHFALNHSGMIPDIDDPVALGVGDFDGDRKSDLVVHSIHATGSSTTKQDLFVLYGAPATGASGSVTHMDIGESPQFDWTYTGSNSVVVADLNGDKKLDIAVQDPSAGAVSVCLGTGGRQLGPMTPYAVGGVAVAAGDLNGDGGVDLATVDPSADHACVLLGDGNGAFGAATCIPSGGFSTSITINRFNSADGSLDLATAQSGAAVLLNTCPTPIDIRATGIEVTQLVQDLANSVMLVAGKRTFARVHTTSNVDKLAVTASLQAFDSHGAPLGDALLPGNPRALVSLRSSPDRGAVDEAFYFELPTALTQAGSITLKATVNPLHTFAESDYGNNVITSPSLTFVATKAMKLHVVDYSYKRPDGFVVRNDPGDLIKLAADVRSKLPIDNLVITSEAVYDSLPASALVDGIDRPEDADSLLSWVQSYRATNGNNAGVLYFVLTRAVKGRSDNIPGWNAVGLWDDAAHEIGHLLGRRHVNCSGTEDGADENYPYPEGKIGGPASDRTRYYGWNSGTDRPTVVPPTAGDLMSYCTLRWLSDYSLKAMWNYRQNQPLMAAGAGRLRAASLTGDFLAVYGGIDRATEDLSLTTVRRLSEVGEVPPSTAGPYHIRLLDEFGGILADHPFDGHSTSEGGTGVLFGQIVDFAPGSREVQIYSDNSARVLASVPISAYAPTVSITSPIAGVSLSVGDAVNLEWIGSDLDGDALRYDVYYSADNGSTWRLLLKGLSSESAIIESDLLAGTSAAWLRVVASDGVLTGSDQAGPMTVANKAPLVEALHIFTNATFAFGQTVTLEAQAQDFEDGSVDDSRFSWFSDKSGPLGYGRLLHVLDLPSGTHTITVEATDLAGETGHAAVVVTVGPAGIRNSAPAFTSISANMTAKEGATVTLSASASDPDAQQAIGVTASGYPADLTCTPGSAVAPSAAQATISGMLGYSDGDLNPTKYTIEWLGTDGTLSVTASTELSVMDVVPIAFDLTPGTLNLKSMGRWVTGYLEPPSPYTAADIDTPSIALNSVIPADGSAPSQLGDHDGDGIADLAVKFDRGALELNVDAGESVEVVVTGTMAGHYFIGTDYIRVIRAKVTSPAAGASLTPGSRTTIAWATPSGVKIQSVALLSSIDAGTTWNLEASGLPNSGSYDWTVPIVSTSQARVAVVLVESADETGYLVDGVLGTSGTFGIGNVTGVSEGGAPELVLRVVRPNPTQDELKVSFGLADARPARIDVFSVTGRRVASREVGGMGPGFHTVTLDERRALPSGVYLVRLTQAGKKLTTRAVVVR